MKDVYQSEDSLAMKKAFFGMVEKFQTIGLNLITVKKFKTSATAKLNRIDELTKSSVTKDEFRDAMKELTEQFHISQDSHVRKVHERMEEMQLELSNQMVKFEEQIGKTEAETKWKINDVEKLLETRATIEQMSSKIETQQKEMTAAMNVLKTDFVGRLAKQKQVLTATDNEHQRLIEVSVRMLKSDLSH